MLVFVQLFDVQQRVLVVRIQPDHLVERFERAIDKPAALEVEAEAQEDVRLFEPGQPRTLEQALMDIDGARDLSLLPVQAAEQQVDFERVSQTLGRLVQLVDGEIDLVGDEKIEPDDVVEGLGDPAAIDQAPRSKLVALPGLPNGQSEEQRDQRSEKRVVGAQNNSVRHRLCR